MVAPDCTAMVGLGRVARAPDGTALVSVTFDPVTLAPMVKVETLAKLAGKGVTPRLTRPAALMAPVTSSEAASSTVMEPPMLVRPATAPMLLLEEPRVTAPPATPRTVPTEMPDRPSGRAPGFSSVMAPLANSASVLATVVRSNTVGPSALPVSINRLVVLLA